MKNIITVLLGCATITTTIAQSVPAENENIKSLVTFGPNAGANYGDDDHVQTFFFQLPAETHDPFYIRVYDPENSGENDHLVGSSFNSATRFSVYGGEGTHNEAAKATNPIDGYKAGELLDTKIFGSGEAFNDTWHTFGPFYPEQGEVDKALGGFLFKIIAEGVKGDDGNLYKYFLSKYPERNEPISGANAFTYEYTFRLQDPNSVTHMYPFVDEFTTAIKQFNFDLDDNADIRIYSRAKNGQKGTVSGDKNWTHSVHQVVEKEKNACQDIQIIRKGGNYENDLSFYVLNQYDEAVKFFSSPIGKIRFEFDVDIQRK